MASDHKTKIFVATLLLALVLSSRSNGAEVTQRTVILSTTTSTQDSGLLDVLIPLFETQTGYSVKTISVGTGQAFALAAKVTRTWRWCSRIGRFQLFRKSRAAA